MPTSKSQSLSLVLHGAALIALIALNSRVLQRSQDPPLPDRAAKLWFVPPAKTLPGAQPAGGANRAEAPARKGTPPPPGRYFIPPVVKADPILPMALSMEFDSPTVVLAAAPTGDPYSKFGGTSLGSGGVGGIGIGGCCVGIGDHSGPGGPGPGGASTGRGITPPRLIYKIEPEFSEEARKAKFQGTVILTVEVDITGHASHFVIVSSPGMGLDQKAIDAVGQWRFRPAYRDGKPFVTSARIEVGFHLL